MSTMVERELLFDPQYIRHKRTIKALRKNMNEQAIYLRITTVIAVLFTVIIVIFGLRIVNLTHQVENLTEENAILVEENENLHISFEACSNLLYEVSEIAVTLDDSNAELLNINAGLNEVINGYEGRAELYDKYEYVIIREDGTRTDIEYAQIESLQDLCSSKGMTDETVDLILSIVMTESRGIETAKNNKSSASGFGQFLSTTGEFVYERLMGNEEYTHELAMNGDINLEMMVEYLLFLDEKYCGNMNSIINEYRGLDSLSYKEKINSYLANNNLSLATVRITE